MDSYFNLNGKFSSMKQKLAASAVKYISKDIIKHVPSITKTANKVSKQSP